MSVDLDFLRWDDTLTEDQRMIRDAVREFVDTDVLPNIGRWCDEGTFPEQLIPKIADLGLLGVTVPEEYGGAGLDYHTYGLITQELERGDSGLRSFASVQSSLCMFPILKYGSEEQKRKFLPDMAAGKKIGCFGLTEPEGGSNPATPRTTAKKTANGWVLNGEKMWITNGGISALAVVWAQTGNSPADIRGFIVERGTKGFSTPEIKKKIGLRASITSSIVLEDCEVGDDALMPGTDCGLKAPLSCLSMARFGIAYGGIGAAIGCLEEALDFTSTRKPFTKTLDHYQLIQAKLANVFTDICLAQGLAYRVGALLNDGKWIPEHISMAKRNNVRMALEAARTCREILGANGITYEFHAGRHETNLISVDTYEGTYDIHTLILGRHLTGKAAFD